jgi:hypothetical protein
MHMRYINTFQEHYMNTSLTLKTNVTLDRGAVSVYTNGRYTLHAYQAGDALGDEAYIIETDKNLVMIELPPFHANLTGYVSYVKKLNKPLTDIMIAYHPSGYDYFPGAKLHMTATTVKAVQADGGIKGLIDNFIKVFGKSFDEKLPEPIADLKNGPVTIGGVNMIITEDADGYDIELPDLNAVYIHMMGSNVHNILTGNGHIDAFIAQLESYKAKNYSLILTSHYVPETIAAADTKIAYLRQVKMLAASCKDAAEFTAAVEKAFPTYEGENYLQITAGIMFPAK